MVRSPAQLRYETTSAPSDQSSIRPITGGQVRAVALTIRIVAPCFFWVTFVAGTSLFAADPAPAKGNVEYLRDIKPLFKQRCASCHGSVKQKGDLRLDAGVLIPRESHEELLLRVTSTDTAERMPPEGAPLSASQIDLLKEWLKAGAPYPPDEVIPVRPEEHWSFQRLQRPPVPESAHPHPVDAFLFREGPAAPKAGNPALIRRVYLDLIGLPPTIDELGRLETQFDLAALIDDLLSRPEYGERWARHWLDVVRYADSNGYERDAEKPFVWRYRDYVISAFNADKPFDQFVLEQIAGDELDSASVDSRIATGFLRLGHWDDEPAEPETDRFDQLDDVVSTTSQAFLGLTIGCARCHDHKFEPLSMRDYYSLVAVFNSLERPQQGRTELTVKDGNTEIYAWREKSGLPPETHVLLRGNPARLGDRVEPSAPAVLSSTLAVEPPPQEGVVRSRLRFAHWVASSKNPLTARVIVNRIWQQHFGEGLVTTANDFGLMGARPRHPELLDWLADWFMHDAGWSLKKLHRLLLTSQAWQSRKTPNSPIRNRRLEVEAIRDSMLAVSGQLNPKRFGPAMRPPIPLAAIDANADRSKVWKPSEEPEASRRSIYAFVKRGLLVPMFETLDLADTVSSCPQRQVTTVAPQALTLFNGEFVQQQSRSLAERLKQEVGNSHEAQIDRLWRLALSRFPTDRERQEAKQFLNEESLEQLARVVLNLNEFVYPE